MCYRFYQTGRMIGMKQMPSMVHKKNKTYCSLKLDWWLLLCVVRAEKGVVIDKEASRLPDIVRLALACYRGSVSMCPYYRGPVSLALVTGANVGMYD